MSARQSLSALLATRGKGGTLESITQAGEHFKADSTLTPSDFISGEKLDASKATTLLGGYVVARYNIEDKTAYSMRNVFAQKWREVVNLFDLNQADFISSINELEGELASRKLMEQNLAESLGTDAEGYIKTATSSIMKIKDGNISPKVRHDLLTLIALAQSKVEYSPLKVAQNA
jgi:hypothetical protein